MIYLEKLPIIITDDEKVIKEYGGNPVKPGTLILLPENAIVVNSDNLERDKSEV